RERGARQGPDGSERDGARRRRDPSRRRLDVADRHRFRRRGQIRGRRDDQRQPRQRSLARQPRRDVRDRRRELDVLGDERSPEDRLHPGGRPDAATRYTSLSLTGASAGTGILIIENGVVEIAGSFRWNGPIVVTGRNVGIRFRGEGTQVIYGAAIVNESNPAAFANVEGDTVGKPHILYSNEALGLVQNALKRRLVTTQNWTDQ